MHVYSTTVQLFSFMRWEKLGSGSAAVREEYTGWVIRLKRMERTARRQMAPDWTPPLWIKMCREPIECLGCS